MLGILFVGLAPFAAATPYSAESTPPELAAWVPWLRADLPALDCAVTTPGTVCRWPSRLSVDARADAGVFLLEVTLDAPGPVILPGGPGAWPTDVVADGRPIAVLDQAGRPTARLPRGTHTIRGGLSWTQRPAGLAVPPDVGVVEVSVDGVPLERPGLDTDGRLRLTKGDAADSMGSRLEIDVSRRIDDGAPVIVTTRVDMRASGVPRELNLGAVSLPGTVPVQLESDIPARFGPEGDLVVLVRPGTWSVTFVARHQGPATTLTAPTLAEPWPEVEYWAWKPDGQVRAANVSGPPGIDPGRTPLPEDWRSYATYRVTPATPLVIEELRRGEPEPPPNQLTLQRELWLDLDGGGWTARDSFAGTMTRGWRFDALPPLVLGSANAGGEAQVVTTGANGLPGVETREADVRFRAESRIQGSHGVLPTVGWSTDVSAMSATVHLPPGWSLLAALGVDSTGDGSLVDRWSLWDLFFVLVLSLATWRVLGWRWGLVSLTALTLGRHDPWAPAWIWPLLLAVVATAQAVPWDLARQIGRWMVWGLLVVLALITVNWAVPHLRGAIWPSLADSDETVWYDNVELGMSDVRYGPTPSDSWEGKDLSGKPHRKSLTLQVDPGAKVQTGPGVPNWSWRRVSLIWSGPVTEDQSMRLVLLDPWTNLALAVLRVGLFLALGLGFASAARRLPRPASPPGDPAPAAGALGAGALIATIALLGGTEPAAAQEPMAQTEVGEPAPPNAPPAPAAAPDLLDQLRARLLAAPDCRPTCVTVEAARIALSGENLRIEAEVHAGALASWPVPGPATSWVPARVTLDGQPAALARLGDGHLHARVSPGVHVVVVEGPAPAGDAITLSWGLPPQRLDWIAEGWSLEGRRADGSAESFAQLSRQIAEGGAEGQRAEELAPWVEVERFVDLGVPWRIETTVRRVGPALQPLALRIQLLPGESITEDGYEGDSTSRLVTLARDQEVAAWTSTLAAAPSLTLTAPDAAWTEVWRVSCSPVFACTFDGPPPLRHIAEMRLAPTWRPWPGETVNIQVARPPGLDGQTTTIDQVDLVLVPGRRQLRGDLTVRARSSQGGVQILTLPPGARLTQARVSGEPQPVQLREDSTVQIPVRPGDQTIELSFLADVPHGLWFSAPPVDVGGPAVNVRVQIDPSEERWIIALFGPSWGPTPQYLVYLVLVLVGSVLLWRIPGSPLPLWQWVLLGLGMTQVPAFVPLIVAAWLIALAWRGRIWPSEPILFNLVQIGLLGLTAIALVCVYAAVHAGLLFSPDMQIEGNGSSDSSFRWYVDRVDGSLPTPTVLSAPVWVWRVLMLIWALWAAASVVSWLRTGFTHFGRGGYLRLDPFLAPVKRAPAPSVPDPAPSTPDPG